MPYISLDNLTQYNSRLRDYIDGSFDKLDGANWRKTSAAQSVSCWPIPESPLEPEVSFLSSETPPESGDKGPDNPSTIVGVESVSCNVCESEGVDDTPYSIDLGGTYYGGSVDFATGVLEVTWWGEYVSTITNTELISNYVRFTLAVTYGHMGSGSAPAYFRSNYDDDGTYVYPRYSAGTARISVSLPYEMLGLDPSTATVETARTAFESFLAQHPCFVVYKLYTPQTVPLTPVLVRSLPALSHYVPRQNTIYTPHESVQVGYAKSASKTSQDLANAIVALGGNV